MRQVKAVCGVDANLLLMEFLKKAILEKGKVFPGNVLKVGSFLNNQLDVKLIAQMADAIYEYFYGKGITKIFQAIFISRFFQNW